MRPLVLIIESDSDTSALLGDRLAAYGFDVIETHKPGHALLLIKNWAHTRRSFNGILLNLEPPFSDGLDTLQELVELHPEIPVIVLCASSACVIASTWRRLSSRRYSVLR